MPSLLHNSSFIYRITLFLLFFCYLTSYSQIDSIQYEVEAQAIGTTGGVVPFWMRSNQYGSIPLAGASGSFIGRAYKEYDNNNHSYFEKSKVFDWGMGFEGRVNTGKTSEFILTEAYLKARLGLFQLKGGRAKETMGLTGDTSLTSGSFAVSGNALGIPKIDISVPEYYTLPFFGGLFAFKGNFAHGWVGNVSIQDTIGTLIPLVKQAETFFHQKSFYGRLGKREWKLKIYSGFNHQAYWGNEKIIFPYNLFKLSKIESYIHVVSGREYNSSKVGNHLGSIDLGLEYDFSNLKVMIYRQNFYDVGALYYLANLRDGLNGISLTNKHENKQAIQWQKLLLEVITTKNQAGELWSKPTPSGDEDYYNNYFYTGGWSYKKTGIGTPFISTKISTKKDLASEPRDYFINNRIIALQAGIEGIVKRWYYTGKASYSMNYGTFGTSSIGHSTGRNRHLREVGIFKKVNQFSAYLEGKKKLQRGIQLGIIVAIDKGGLYDNSSSFLLKFTKSVNR